MTFRLTEQEYAYLEQSAYMMGTTPSKFVRQLIQMAINTTKLAEQKAKEATEEMKAEQLALLESNAVK